MKLFNILLFISFVTICLSFNIRDLEMDQRTDGSGLVDIWFNISDLESDECVDLFLYPTTMAEETLTCRTFIEPASPRTICDDGLYHILWNFASDEPLREFRDNQIYLTLYAGHDGFYPGPCDFRPKLSAGIHWTVALKRDGTVWAWGREYCGCLGTGGGSTEPTPVRVSGIRGHTYLENIQAIYSDGWHNAALHEDGTVWTWGYNVFGRLGDGTTSNRYTPVQVRGVGGTGFLTDIQAIEIGNESTLALTRDGNVLTWGRNCYGQLGIGSYSDSHVPEMVLDPLGGYLDNVRVIYGGKDHDLIIKNDGTVWTWGWNNSGQLGNGTTTTSNVPTQVVGVDGVGFLDNIVQVVGGNFFSLALDEDGNVYSWGSYEYLGTGTTSSSSTPVRVLGPGGVGFLENIIQLACADEHCMALSNDGHVYTWGHNFRGQLGDGTYSSALIPQTVVAPEGSSGFFEDVAFIEGGRWHSIAYKHDGTVWTWGINDYYEHGTGALGASNRPEQVHGFGDVGFFNLYE